jgi:type IV pilus assembly protein PilM
MTFWNKKELSFIGLDIASTAVRGVQLSRQGGTTTLHSALEVPFDAVDLPDDESCHDEEKLLAAITHLIDLGGFQGNQVMIHCPVEKLSMRPVTIPSGPEGLARHTILDVLRHQLAEYTPFPIDQAVIDYLVLEHNPQAKQLNLMTISADGHWIEKQILLLRNLKLNCVSVDPMPSTLSRLVGPKDQDSDEEELVAILDIGYSGTTLIAAQAGNCLFCRRFSLGAREMTQTLSQHLMIDPVQAQRLNMEFGLHYQSEEKTGDSCDQHIGKTIYAALQSGLDDFTESVIRSLNYVISRQRGARLIRLLLAGTASHTQQLDAYLSDRLEIPVEHIVHPVLRDICQALPASRATCGSWCVATGLALSAFENFQERSKVEKQPLEVA